MARERIVFSLGPPASCRPLTKKSGRQDAGGPRGRKALCYPLGKSPSKGAVVPRAAFLRSLLILALCASPAFAQDQPPLPLEGRGLDNLVAFTRLLGYVRYFHPSDTAADTNWNAFAIHAVKEVEGLKGPEDLARR